MHSRHYRRALALLAALLPCAAFAQGSTTLTWLPPTTNTDGSALTDLAGYRVYWDTQQGELSNSVTVADPRASSFIVQSLTPATWFFAVTAYSAIGVESAYSSVVTKTIAGPPPAPLDLPGAVRNLDVHPLSATAARFVRWTITKRRGGDNSIQLADVQLMLGANPVPWPSSARALNPGGMNPPGEEPARAIDVNAATKWLDFNFQASATAVNGSSTLLVDVGAEVTFDGYRWRTANDFPTRDPVSWRLETAPASSGPWAIRSSVIDAAVPTARGAWSQSFAF